MVYPGVYHAPAHASVACGCTGGWLYEWTRTKARGSARPGYVVNGIPRAGLRNCACRTGIRLSTEEPRGGGFWSPLSAYCDQYVPARRDHPWGCGTRQRVPGWIHEVIASTGGAGATTLPGERLYHL